MTTLGNTNANKQIFKRAIQKARENGFTHFVGETEQDFAKFLTLLADEHIDLFFDRREMWAAVLYDYCFCRAFWGTASVIPIGKCGSITATVCFFQITRLGISRGICSSEHLFCAARETC
jgi:hypothetical protein